MTLRRRLDVELVRRSLADSHEQAQLLIEGNKVIVSGSLADRPSRLVGNDEPIILRRDPSRFVSRGGEKLEVALSIFDLPTALIALVSLGVL